VPMYGTGDSVGLLVQYEDRTKRPAEGEPSSHTGVTLQFCTSSSAAGAGREGGGESNGADGASSAMTIDTEAGNEKHHSGGDEAEGSAEKAEVNDDDEDSGERDFGGGGEGAGGDDEDEDSGSVRIRRQRAPIEALMQLAAAEQKQQKASMASDAAESESAQATTKRPRKGPKLVLYLFLNGQWCYTWNYTRPPPHAEIAFTVALNGTGACVALNKEEDPVHREKRQELRRANAITATTLHLPPSLTPNS